jgi:hypothetical protein
MASESYLSVTCFSRLAEMDNIRARRSRLRLSVQVASEDEAHWLPHQNSSTGVY